MIFNICCIYYRDRGFVLVNLFYFLNIKIKKRIEKKDVEMNHLTGLRFHQKLYVLGRKSKYYPISTFARHNNKKKTIVRSFQFWFRNFRIHEPNKVQS